MVNTLMSSYAAIYFFTVSTTVMITMAAAISITAITQPTTMPAIQPVEHPPPDTDCAGSMFIVVVVLWGFESVFISVVVGDTVVDAGSEKENECAVNT